MGKAVIGIAGGGFQGRNAALWFARRQMDVVIYDINDKQFEIIREEMGKSVKRALYNKHIQLTTNILDLKKCELIIENAPENLDLKIKILKEIEDIVSEETVISSNSSSYIPTELCRNLDRKDKFVNIHFLGVPWGVNDLELVRSEYTSTETMEFCKDVLQTAGFNAVEIKECPGFVFNRVKGMELTNLIRAMEQHKLMDLSTYLRYLLYPIRGQWTTAFIDFLGVEITLSLSKYLYQHYNDRAYIPQIIEEMVQRNELGVKTGKGFFEYPDRSISIFSTVKKQDKSIKSRYKRVFMNNAGLNQTNILMAMQRVGKELYFESYDKPFFEILTKVNKSAYEKIVPNLMITSGNEEFDIIYDTCVTSLEETISRVDLLSEKFGKDIPIVINTPIHKASDIAKGTKHPDKLIFVINSQKSYLFNVELVKNDKADADVYNEIKNFIYEVSGDCMEVEDASTRPLMFLLAAKYFEAVRCLEEGISTKEDIVVLLEKDNAFKDIDLFGLDKLKFVADYLWPVYKQPFEVPKYLNKLIEEGNLGVMTGEGFYKYY